MSELLQKMYLALKAQEVASDMQQEMRDRKFPAPDDPRYNSFIGPYDGYKAPEQRYYEFMVFRRNIRKEALEQYEKENPNKGQ